MKTLLAALGGLCLVLGVVGIFVPLLPTTPFLLLAAALWMRSSPRLHDWLLSHGRLGGYIRDFREKRAIPLHAKILSVALLWGSIGWGRRRSLVVGAGRPAGRGRRCDVAHPFVRHAPPVIRAVGQSVGKPSESFNSVERSVTCLYCTR